MKEVDTSDDITFSDHLKNYPFLVREWIYTNYDKEIHLMLEEMHDVYLLEMEHSYYDWDYRLRTVFKCKSNEKCSTKPSYTKEDMLKKWERSKNSNNVGISEGVFKFITNSSSESKDVNSSVAFYSSGTWEYNIQGSSMRSSSYPSGVCYTTSVPFYSEWGADNPNSYWWCGHAALKCVGKAHGTYKSLTTIHNYFWNNSPGYSGDRCNNGDYCSSYEDLLIGAKGAGLYGHSSSSKDYVSSKLSYCQKLMDGVWYDKPVIALSEYLISAGHFYVIAGFEVYYTSGTNIDYNASIFYLRDVYQTSPTYTYWDKTVSFQDFYDDRLSANVLVVRPGSLSVYL